MDTGERNIWQKIKDRCLNPRSRIFRYYGGRGIKLCARWRRSFETFLKDVGPRPSSKHTIERCDNDGDYGPNNVRWATRREQSRNRRSNRPLTFMGRTMLLGDWARELGMNQPTLSKRLNILNWPVSLALSTKPKIGQQVRKAARLSYKGQTKLLKQWAKEVGIPAERLYERIRNGWLPRKALLTPVRRYSR